jgi:hypothetical protein
MMDDILGSRNNTSTFCRTIFFYFTVPEIFKMFFKTAALQMLSNVHVDFTKSRLRGHARAPKVSVVVAP